MERNTVLALDEFMDDLSVDTASQTARILERRLNGRLLTIAP